MIVDAPETVNTGASTATPALLSVAVPSAPWVDDVNVTVPVGTVVLEDVPETVAVSVALPPTATTLAEEATTTFAAAVPLPAVDVAAVPELVW